VPKIDQKQMGVSEPLIEHSQLKVMAGAFNCRSSRQIFYDLLVIHVSR